MGGEASEDEGRPGAVRRRGAALEAALLKAAWDELRESGYASVTIDAVARRAGTSRTVIYRRWPNRAQLLLATLRAHVVSISEVLPDTGDLRGDVLALLRTVAHRFTEFSPDLINGLLSELDSLPADTFTVFPRQLAELIARADERDGRSPIVVPPHILSVPVVLVRHDLIVSRQQPSEPRLEQIVDEVFLPLLESVRAVAVR